VTSSGQPPLPHPSSAMPPPSGYQTSRTPQIIQTSGVNVNKKQKNVVPPQKNGEPSDTFYCYESSSDEKRQPQKTKGPKHQKKSARKSKVLSQIFSSEESEESVALGSLPPIHDEKGMANENSDEGQNVRYKRFVNEKGQTPLSNENMNVCGVKMYKEKSCRKVIVNKCWSEDRWGHSCPSHHLPPHLPLVSMPRPATPPPAAFLYIAVTSDKCAWPESGPLSTWGPFKIICRKILQRIQKYLPTKKFRKF
jgi:hypothetical protein